MMDQISALCKENTELRSLRDELSAEIQKLKESHKHLDNLVHVLTHSDESITIKELQEQVKQSQAKNAYLYQHVINPLKDQVRKLKEGQFHMQNLWVEEQEKCKTVESRFNELITENKTLDEKLKTAEAWRDNLAKQLDSQKLGFSEALNHAIEKSIIGQQCTEIKELKKVNECLETRFKCAAEELKKALYQVEITKDKFLEKENGELWNMLTNARSEIQSLRDKLEGKK